MYDFPYGGDTSFYLESAQCRTGSRECLEDSTFVSCVKEFAPLGDQFLLGKAKPLSVEMSKL